MTTERRQRQIIAGLLTAATIFFVWGALAERASSHSETPAAHHDATTSTPKAEGGDGDAHGVSGTETTQRTTPATSSETGGSEAPDANSESPATTTPASGDVHGAGGSESNPNHSETSTENRKILGINLESLWVILLGAAVSLGLAALVVVRRSRAELVGVVVLAAGFVVLEIGEIQHQHTEHRSGLVALAAIAGVLHLAAALTAGGALATGNQRESVRP